MSNGDIETSFREKLKKEASATEGKSQTSCFIATIRYSLSRMSRCNDDDDTLRHQICKYIDMYISIVHCWRQVPRKECGPNWLFLTDSTQS